MHKYFNFTKIYEAEQEGRPLDPEEMGTPGSLPEQQPSDKLEDFDRLAKENILEITLTKHDCDDLKDGKSVLKKKPEAQWKDKNNETKVKDISLVILNTKNDTAKNEPDALVFNLDDSITNDIVEGIKLGNVTQVLKGLGQDGTDIPGITVRFIKSVELDISSTETVIPATPEQIENGAVTPEAVVGEIPNESRGIMNFNQFVNEAKKNSKKDTLKKELKKKNKNFLNESFLDKAKIIVSRLNKNKQATNQLQSTDIENVEKSLSEFAAKMKSANLGTYKGQLQTIVEPLGSLYMRLEDLNAEDCRKGSKPGTLAAQRMEPIKNQIYDIFQRVYVDMRTELLSNNLLTQQEAESFTIDDAIELLYTRYNQQKGFLKNIAMSIVKVAGGGYVSAQMLTIISDGIRKKFGERTGGLANSIITDFIGGLFTVMADDSLGDCVPQTTSSSQEASIRQGL